MNDKMKINLKVGGKSYSLSIRREDEELVRAAAREVDQKYNRFLERADKLQPIEAMTMTAIQYAVDLKTASDWNDTEPYASKVEDLSKLLESYIQKK